MTRKGLACPAVSKIDNRSTTTIVLKSYLKKNMHKYHFSAIVAKGLASLDDVRQQNLHTLRSQSVVIKAQKRILKAIPGKRIAE